MSQYDFRGTEKAVNKLWKKLNVKALVDKQNAKGKPYFLLDGPPYANNIPHVGHIRNTVYKDLYLRYAAMQGQKVLYKPGFDTHGLPIENMVEKKLKINSKQDIHKYGVQKFLAECKANATKYKDLWIETYDILGSYYGGETPYLTYNNSYIESVWWTFKKIWDQGLVYEGQRPVFWCPHCQTSLSGYEVTDSYKIVTDPSVYVKFKLAGEEKYVLVYTTTPWTLPANVALAVHQEKDYVEVETKEGTLIIAKKLASTVLAKAKLSGKTKRTFKGRELIGRKYEPLLKLPQQEELKSNPKAHKIYGSIKLLKERVASKVSEKKGIKARDVFEDFVTDEDGTGIVHTAPGHGKTDFIVGNHYKLPAVSPLNSECKFTDLAGKYKGKFVKDADHDISEDLHQQGKLLHFESIQHKYPLCWRCKAPLIFKLNNQWFIDVNNLKKTMMEESEKVTWQPPFAQERMRNWLANIEDWNFSRQRFWGTPIPIWKSEDGDYIVAGSEEEFRKLTKAPKNFDLHAAGEKTVLKNGKKYRRVPDIFDVWFDSGAAPFASLHYPFENKALFEKYFPVARINEGQDQIRGWFYSLLNISSAVFKQAPYQTVSMSGWVLDAKGEKMSKSLGNFIGAKEACEELGADIVRYYYCWDSAPYHTAKFSKEVAKTEVYRFFNILHNLHNYILKEDFKLTAKPKTIEDEWIMSRLNTTIKVFKESVENFELHTAGRALYDFVIEDLSRKYVQIIRERAQDDSTPYSLIYQAIKKVIILLTPIAPHASEAVYQAFKEKEKLKLSVQLERIPIAGKTNPKLEQDFNGAFEVITALLAAREKAGISLRQPVAEVDIRGYTTKTYTALILKQGNVKKLTWKKHVLDVEVKPNYRNIGKKLGSDTADFLEGLKKNQETIKKAIFKDGYKYKKELLTKEDFELKPIIPAHKTFGESKNVTVLLETQLSSALQNEGLVREVMRRVQTLRKSAGLEKSDRIKLQLAGPLKGFDEEIKKVTGATIITRVKVVKAKHHDQFKTKGKEFSIGF